MNTKLFGAALMSIAMFSCKKNLVEDNQLAQRSAIDPTTPKNVQPYMINENAGPTTTNAAYGGVVPWNLTWSDEFTTNGVNHSKWTERNGAERWRTFNPGNVSVYCYQSSDMISQTGDGYVRIGAMKWKDGTTYKLKCGLMDTENLFDQQYGYFEARMKVPNPVTIGSQASFWLMSQGELIVGNDGHDGAEIDVFESSFLNNKLQSTMHWDSYTAPYHKSPGRQWTASPSFCDGNFHVFGVKWLYNELKIYYDGQEVALPSLGQSWPQGIPWVKEFIKLSTHGVWGDAKDGNNYSTAANYTTVNTVIDWVRVYK